MLSLLKLLRVLRMGKVAVNIDSYTKNGPVSLILIIMFFILLGHLIACGWFWLGTTNYKAGKAGWISIYLIENNYSLHGAEFNSKIYQGNSEVLLD